MGLDSQVAYFADYISAGRLVAPPVEWPAQTVAIWRADLPTPLQNDQPVTSAQVLILGAGATTADGTLTTTGAAGSVVRSPYLTGTDATKEFDVFFTLIDAGPGTGDASLALFSVGSEDHLDSYLKVTVSADAVGSRSLVLNFFDKGTSGGVTTKLPAGLGLTGVHTFRVRANPAAKFAAFMHVPTATVATTTISTYSWTGKLCVSLGGAYRGLQGVAPNQTPRGAEKFLEARAAGIAVVHRAATLIESQNVGTLLAGTYRYPTVALSPATVTRSAGGAPVTFTATLANTTAAPTWTLIGVGTLQPNGLTAVYTPPGSVSATSQAIIRASVAGGTTFESIVTLNTLVAPSTRGPVQVDATFSRSKLPTDAQTLYDGSRAWITALSDTVKAEVLSGSPNSPGGNKVDLYELRKVRQHLHAAALMLDATGDPAALANIIEIWTLLIAKAETTWNPGYNSTFSDATKAVGTKRFNYYNLASKTFAEFIAVGGYTNRMPLESDLHAGYCAELRYVLYQNRGFSAAVDTAYAQVVSYHDGLTAQRKLFSAADYPSKPNYTWGKALHHPTEGRYAEAFLMVKMGYTSWQAELDKLTAWLLGDRELLEHPGGYKVYNTAHGVQGRYLFQQGSGDNFSSQDCTYIGEEWASAELLCRSGDTLFNPEVMSAIGRTCDQGVFYDGYAVKTYFTKDAAGNPVGVYTIGGSIGGGGLPTTGSTLFCARSGARMNSRWKTPGNNFRENLYQVQRNGATAPMWRVLTPAMDTGLTAVANQATLATRKGPTLTRFLTKINGRA